MKGAANIRSSLADVTARAYSRARWWGWYVGSRLRWSMRWSPLHSRVVDACDRERAFIFIVGVCVLGFLFGHIDRCCWTTVHVRRRRQRESRSGV